MRNPCNKNTRLKEHLLDEEDPNSGFELPRLITEQAELEQDIIKWGLDYPPETPEEKVLRMSIEDRVDRLTIAGYSLIVGISVLSCASVMLFIPGGVFEMLFTMSILQGPFVMYQRLQITRSRSKREVIATLWSESLSLKQSIDGLESDIDNMNTDVGRLKLSLGRYQNMIKDYDISGISDLFHENEKINEQKKLLAEAIGMQKLTKCILQTDANKDHHVGEAELSLLAHRIELVEGVPFTTDELFNRFRLEENQNLRNLADVVRRLYADKRREQARTKAMGETENSPRKLGAPLLWKRKIDGIGIAV